MKLFRKRKGNKTQEIEGSMEYTTYTIRKYGDQLMVYAHEVSNINTQYSFNLVPMSEGSGMMGIISNDYGYYKNDAGDECFVTDMGNQIDIYIETHDDKSIDILGIQSDIEPRAYKVILYLERSKDQTKDYLTGEIHKTNKGEDDAHII